MDVTDQVQMKIWSTALLNMGKNMIDNKTERCETCYYAPKVVDTNGKININLCPNNFCPVKSMPTSAAEVIELMFQKDYPINISFVFNNYVEPILNKLIEEEQAASKRQ